MGRENSSQIVFGIILIFLGILFLLHTLNLIPAINWIWLIDLWPLLLVFIGLNLLFKGTRLWWVTPILLILLLIFFLFSGQFFDNQDSYPLNSGIVRNSSSYQPEIDILKTNINFSGGSLVIDSTRDEDNIYETRLRYRGNRPVVDYARNEEQQAAILTVEKKKDANWLNFTGRDDWKVYLAKTIPVDLEINAGAGKLNLNLAELKVVNLQINAGAGDLEIDFGNYDSQVVLNSGTANVELNIPREAGISITSSGVISNNNFIEAGLNKTANGSYRSQNYERADFHIGIKITTAASNLELKLH